MVTIFSRWLAFIIQLQKTHKSQWLKITKKTKPGYLDFLNIFKFLALNFVACRNLFTFLSISKALLKLKKLLEKELQRWVNFTKILNHGYTLTKADLDLYSSF